MRKHWPTAVPKKAAVVLMCENTNTLALVQKAGDLLYPWDFLTINLTFAEYNTSWEWAQECVNKTCQLVPLENPCHFLGYEVNFESAMPWIFLSVPNDRFFIQSNRYKDIQVFDYKTLLKQNISDEVRNFFGYYHQHTDLFANFKTNTILH